MNSIPERGLRAQRDVRIDFFRGVALLWIFVTHMPLNAWSQYMPSRFGFSDAADVFVFCSGLASGIAYGRAYGRSGFLAGTARVALRCWQVYWAHISLFIFIAAMMVAADHVFGRGDDYVAGLNLQHLFTGDTAANLLGLVTLTYVPNLFDILPLYVVLLAMIPVFVLLARFAPAVALTASVGLWVVASQGYFQFPAEPWSDRSWHFHPFAWQLLFFSGFAFARGWLPVPPIDRRALAVAAVLLVSVIPIAFWPIAEGSPVLRSLARTLAPWCDKTHYGVLRLAHFACAAYLAYGLSGFAGQNLKGRAVDVVATVGQHSLGVFLMGVVLSMAGGILLRELGYHPLSYPLANVTGWMLLIGSAYLIGWTKSKPWTRSALDAKVRRDAKYPTVTARKP